MTQRRFLILVFLLAASLRIFVAFWHYEDMNVDEVVSAYEAYSLVETGKDRTGASWPLYFYNFGFGENVTYAYLLFGLFKIFGVHAFLTPVPSLVFNVAAVMVFYFFIRRLFTEKIAQLATMLFVFSPWHLILTSYEYNVALIPFLLFAGLWGYLKAVQAHKPWGFILTLLCFVLAFYTYGIAMMVLPFGVFLLVFFFPLRDRFMRINLFLVALLGMLLVLPFVLFLLQPTSGNVSLWSGSFPVLQWSRASLFIPPALPPLLAYQQIVQNFLSMFSFAPWFLNLDFYVAPRGLSLLWIWEAPFIIYGFVHAFRNQKNPSWRFLFWWSVVGIIPALFMAREFNPHPWRLIFLLGIGEVIAGVGVVSMWGSLKSLRDKKIFLWSAGVILTFSVIFFAVRFSDRLPLSVYQFRQGGIAQAMEILEQESRSADRVVISDTRHMYYFFYLDVLWYGRVNPWDFQRTFQAIDDPEPGYFVPQIGNIAFCYAQRGCNVSEEYRNNPQTLFMVRGDELSGIPAAREILFPNGTTAFRFIKTQQ